MALVSDTLKKCGAKINTEIGGVPSLGSGVIYSTPNSYDYNYILTAKHIFQEDSQTPFDSNKIRHIEVMYHDGLNFRRYDYIKRSEFSSRLIVFDEDFAIVVVKKSAHVKVPQILVTDNIEDDDQTFFAWGTFAANEDDLHLFDLIRNDITNNRYKASGSFQPRYLPGLSGAGIFNTNKSVLRGIIKSYPNEDFQNETIDCSRLKFTEINSTLKSLGKVELDTLSSRKKRQVKNEVVYIHEAFINNTVLDLDLARRRLKHDIEDDWFHDPLKYIDLLNEDFLFMQFEPYFGTTGYKASLAEKFYVPKKQFTLRQAMVSPFLDRVMYMAAVSVLAKRLDDAMMPNVYSARYNQFSDNQLILNGVEQWKKMKYMLAECANKKDSDGNFIYHCVIEIDLLNFYDNIDKKLLHEKVKRVCVTPNEKSASVLLHDILVCMSKKDLGLPQNSDASSLLASFYLNQVDTLMIHHVPRYYRFMDDIRIFCKDRYEARKILQTFEFELRRCHLSVNSQKTRILTFSEASTTTNSLEVKRDHYNIVVDFELNKIAQMRRSSNYAYKNDAFHQCIEIMSKTMSDEDLNSSDDNARRLNYSLNTVALLARKGLNIGGTNEGFEKSISTAVNNLKDQPWITSQICKVLNLVPTQDFLEKYFNLLEPLVLDDRYNTYAFQTYQIWLLFAKHKCYSTNLTRFAVRQIEKNDTTNKPVIGAMMIYMGSVSLDYRRVILRKFGEGFTQEYFQNRIALVSLRTFELDMIDQTRIHDSLTHAHIFTHKYSHRDLVYVSGFDEADDDDAIEQLYSL